MNDLSDSCRTVWIVRVDEQMKPPSDFRGERLLFARGRIFIGFTAPGRGASLPAAPE